MRIRELIEIETARPSPKRESRRSHGEDQALLLAIDYSLENTSLLRIELTVLPSLKKSRENFGSNILRTSRYPQPSDLDNRDVYQLTFFSWASSLTGEGLFWRRRGLA